MPNRNPVRAAAAAAALLGQDSEPRCGQDRADVCDSALRTVCELGDRAIGDGTVAPVGAVAELCKYLCHRQEQFWGHLLLQQLRTLVEGPTRKILKPVTAG